MKTLSLSKKMILSTALLMGLNTLSFNAQAGDRVGNGGSGNESQIAASQAKLENVSLKLKHFFIKNESALKAQFPEVNIKTLISKMNSADIRAVDSNNLIDRHGVKRTCLNYADTSVIECSAAEIEKLDSQPSALFVLALHEHLGLVAVEETSPLNPRMIDGYSISKRIAPYVSQVNNYDLLLTEDMQSAESKCQNRQAVKKITTTIGQDEGMSRSISAKLVFDKIVCHEDGKVSFMNPGIMINNKRIKLGTSSGEDVCNFHDMNLVDQLNSAAILTPLAHLSFVDGTARVDKYIRDEKVVNVTCSPMGELYKYKQSAE
jgi:hypothetical protein